MATTHIALVDRSIYLGSSEDPQPIFRDEAADGTSWPAGAVMAIAFTEERFPASYQMDPPPPAINYFEADGWPLGFPAERRTLPPQVKREFQVAPSYWSEWSESKWSDVEEDPDWFVAFCKPIPALSEVLSHLPAPDAQ